MSEETKVCKYCQSEISKKAKICPNCKKKQGPKAGLIILGVGLFLIIVGALAGGSDDSSSKSSSNSAAPVAQAEAPAPVEYMAVSVLDLEDALQTNALKASDTYKGQYLEVSGYLNSIDASGKYFSINAGSDDWSFVNIQCYIKNDDQKNTIMNMNRGDKIVVKGECFDVGEVFGYSINLNEVTAQ